MINGSAINNEDINGSSAGGVDLSRFGGCVKITYGGSQGSGVLLWNGCAILTAAHVVDGVTKGNESLIGIEFFADPSVVGTVRDVVIHPQYSALGYDLAVLVLTEVVDVEVPRYSLYKNFDELGLTFERFAYSPIVNPLTGTQLATSEWRLSKNKYEAFGSALQGSIPIEGDQLLSDYDNGLTANNALNGLLSLTDAGIIGEGGSRPGESGSPTFITVPTASGTALTIIGITRGTTNLSTYDVTANPDGSYGELNYDTRVSSVANWITGAVGALDGQITVAQTSRFVGEGEVVLAEQQSLAVSQSATLSALGGGAISGSFISSFTGIADAWISGNLAVTDFESTFDTNASTLTFSAYGGAEMSVTQAPPLFAAFGAGSVSVDSFLTIPSFNAQGSTGTTSYALSLAQIQTFSAYGAGNLNALEPAPLFTSIALTGGVASLTAAQGALFSGLGDVVESLGVMAVTQPAIVANYGLMVVEQSQSFSAGSATVENNLVAYSMNIKTAETTTYNNFAFKFIVRLGNEYYGVKSDGLYQLGGLTDDGAAINAQFKTAETDFGSTQLKRVPFVYLDLDTDATVSSIADGVANDAVAAAFNGRRTHLARGPKGRFWQMEVANVNGSELKVGSLEIMAELLSRKV